MPTNVGEHRRGMPPRMGRLLFKRVLVVGGSSVFAVSLLVVLFAWIALHVDWKMPDPATLSSPSVVLSRDGQVLARLGAEVEPRQVPLDKVNPDAQHAVIASEDARFYQHTGVDPASLLRAVATNLFTGSISQGGSTLTQQYVKNAYTGSQRTLTRKVREAVISIALERNLSKDEILERYLNTVYFGEGAYGIETAALTYFGKHAAELDVAESATLAQLLPAPSVWNPRADPDLARRRAHHVIDRMQQLGFITAGQAQQAKDETITVKPGRPAPTKMPYFVQYVREQLEAAYGKQAVVSGGLRVTTTIDLHAQQTLDAAVAKRLPPQKGRDIDAGAVAIDPTTGDILAIHGGRDFTKRQFNLATHIYQRQAGSTFKPFVFIAALQQGHDPSETLPAPAHVRPKSCPPNPDGSNPFNEVVTNASGHGYGSMTIANALANSVNTVYVQLGCEVGPQAVVDTAHQLGVRNDLAPVANISIGSGPTGPTPLDMASAFGTLANDGLLCPARSIVSVTGPDGQPQPAPKEVNVAFNQPDAEPRAPSEEALAARPDGLRQRDQGRCKAVVDPNIARTTTKVLERVPTETTATRADIGRPQAGKTGTTNDEQDAWYVGYTPDLSIAIWMGDVTKDPQPLHDVAGFDRVYGGTIPALIWHDAAAEILKDVPPTDFLEPGELTKEPDRAVVAPARSRRTAPPAGHTPAPGPSDAATGGPDEQPTQPGGDGG